MIFKSLDVDYRDAYYFLYNRINALLSSDFVYDRNLIILSVLDSVLGNNDFSLVFVNESNLDSFTYVVDNYSDLDYVLFKDLKNDSKNISYLRNIYDIIIVFYSDINKDNYVFLKSLATNRVTVQDNAYQLKNPDDRFVEMITSICDKASRKYGIVGSDVKNYVVDFWGLMQFYDSTLFGGESEFKGKYCELSNKVFGTKIVNGREVPKERKEITGFKNLDGLQEEKNKVIYFLEDKKSFVSESDNSLNDYDYFDNQVNNLSSKKKLKKIKV